MKLQKVKRMLAVVFVGIMCTTTTVSAADMKDAQPETESVLTEAEQAEAEDSKPAGSEETDTGKATEEQAEQEAQTGEEQADESEPEQAEAEMQPEEALLEEEEADPDERTQMLLEEYREILSRMKTQAVGSYETELAKFPASYQSYLKKLHTDHPNWIFVAVNSSLVWNDIVAAESVSGSSKGTNQSLLPNSSGGILLSKASTDYNTSTGKYIAKDGSSWVSASKPAVAYFVDPRNYLTDNYIYAFEALAYNAQYHTKAGVEKALTGTDLSNKKVSYTNTSGKTVKTDATYGELIYAAGAKNKVSPLFLASKIRQETGAKLTNGSISGKYSYGGKSYTGYYNFYNIGATSTSTGSAVANGLTYAKGGSSKSKTYSRPWTSPLLAIDGGAQFLAASYIGKGQNTIYLQRFNTAYSPYYQHQYMQNLTGVASEAKTTYNSYNKMGILNDAYVFYIPVYKSMPTQSATISIEKKVKTGKITSSVNMRKGPSTGYASITTIPEGKTVTVSEAVHTDISASVSSQESSPYWYKVTYGSKTGYVSYKYVKMNADSTVKVGGTKQLKVTSSASGQKIYYETSNPAVAKVSNSGKITGVKKGTCEIYAVTSSGKKMDTIGISVGTAVSTNPDPAPVKEEKPAAPKLVSLANSTSGVVVKWKKVSNATGYYVYRKSSGSYKKIKTIKSGSTVSYTDTTMKSGSKHTYTVKAYNKAGVGSYNKTGLTIRRLATPKVLSATGTTSGITVKWEKVRSAVEYEVYRKTKDGSYKKIVMLEGTDKLSYKDKSAKKGVTYYYTVRACSGKYKGAYNKTGVKGIRK